MIRVGITGQSGFVGRHFFNQLGLYKELFERVPFEDDFFQNKGVLKRFVRQCDVVVHLAAVNRDKDQQKLYNTNIGLVTKLIEAMESEKVIPYVLFASSIQEESDNLYGRSKRDGRELFEKWAKCTGASFSGLVVPNIYGPFGSPNYNSFIATFCYKLTHGECPVILQDSRVKLIYIGNFCQYVINKILTKRQIVHPLVEKDYVPVDFEKKVSEILNLFNVYKELYYDQGIIPVFKNGNEINLFNTFCCYIDIASYFPVKLTKHEDCRGYFVEIIKLGTGGQISFSMTVPGITRGNHYHTRKIERFTVIKGSALIQLRRIGSDEVLNFELDEQSPAYVDVPVWYTHNITNIGEEELCMQFWISEWYNAEDCDTFFEIV